MPLAQFAKVPMERIPEAFIGHGIGTQEPQKSLTSETKLTLICVQTYKRFFYLPNRLGEVVAKLRRQVRTHYTQRIQAVLITFNYVNR